MLHELPFYDELSVAKIPEAFKRYARSYKIKIIDSKDPLAQLEASKSSTEDLFKDLLNEMKGFKYQMTVKVLLSKHKQNGDMDLHLFFSILQAKHWLILNMILINLFKKFVIELIIGLMKDLLSR